MTVGSGNGGARVTTTTRPRVSLFVMGTSDGAYADLCEQVLFAERLGFDGAWLAERHFANGDLFCPVPTIVLGWLAGRTSRMRLGLAARVLPFHDPVAVAEEALTLDVLTGGRFDLGVARLSMDKESHEAFGVPIPEAAERFPRDLAVLRQALAGHVPGGADLPCTPAAVQSPLPLYVVANSPASQAYVAGLGLNSFVNGALIASDVADALRRFREIADAHGHDGAALDLPVNRFIYVGETRREAERVMAPAFERFMRERAPDLCEGLVRLYGKEALRWEWLSEHVCIAGDVEGCADRLQAFLEQSGTRHILATLNLISLPQDACVASMRRFAEAVIPRLQLPGAQPERKEIPT
jgi:alkanesulfonate monooxygenase SsuD/methylene tetrahydromethanopterin reductase-like flavin-dependent oxidoreductase (luciferase family)